MNIPHSPYSEDFAADGYDGTIEAGMTLCVESYVGVGGGAEGVKLEDQVLITDHGAERSQPIRSKTTGFSCWAVGHSAKTMFPPHPALSPRGEGAKKVRRKLPLPLWERGGVRGR